MDPNNLVKKRVYYRTNPIEYPTYGFQILIYDGDDTDASGTRFRFWGHGIFEDIPQVWYTIEFLTAKQVKDELHELSKPFEEFILLFQQ